MADKKDDQLSPEEKLLRVIQGGGPKRKGAAASAPASGSDAAPAASAAASAPGSSSGGQGAAAPTKAEEAQRLRLAKTGPGAQAKAEPKTESKPAVKAPAKTETKAQAGAAAKASSVSKRPAAGTDLSVRALNIVLAGVILIVLLLTGHEIWANVKITEIGLPVGDVSVSMPSVDPGATVAELASLDELIDALDERPLFAPVMVVATATQPQIAPKPPRPDEYCALLGISEIANTREQEAIVMDRKLNKMMFLKVGDTVAADGQSWKVKAIQADSVIFESGNDQSVVK